MIGGSAVPVLAVPILALLASLFVLAAAMPAAAEKRVALVMGNATYREAPLKNPVNDARAMAAKLKQLGFTVILRENATKLQMERAIADFGDQLGPDAIGLFFYAGHGMQVDGRNFLVPTDAQIASQARVRLETLDVDLVLDQMAVAGSRVNLVILDACRNNPFERRFRATGGGLAQINAPQGTLISYATAPGKVAADGAGDNGLYTTELLRALDTPGLQVEEVFKRVRIEVARASQGAQTPWEASSLTGSFYFREAAASNAAPTPAAAPPMAPDREAIFWTSIQNSGDPALYEAYLQQFPTGTFAPIARSKLDSFRRPPPGPVAALPAAGAAARPGRSFRLALRNQFGQIDCGSAILQIEGNTLCGKGPQVPFSPTGGTIPGSSSGSAAGYARGLHYDLRLMLPSAPHFIANYSYEQTRGSLRTDMQRHAPGATPSRDLIQAGNDTIVPFSEGPPGCVGFDRAGPRQGAGYAWRLFGIVCHQDGSRTPTVAEIGDLLRNARIAQ